MKYGIFGAFLCAAAAGFASPAMAAPATVNCAVKPPPGLVTPGTLTVGSNMSTPPQMYIDKGEPAGFEIDLARAIAGTMCLKPQLVNIAFGGLFPGLVAKKFDVTVSALNAANQSTKYYSSFAVGIKIVIPC